MTTSDSPVSSHETPSPENAPAAETVSSHETASGDNSVDSAVESPGAAVQPTAAPSPISQPAGAPVDAKPRPVAQHPRIRIGSQRPIPRMVPPPLQPRPAAITPPKPTAPAEAHGGETTAGETVTAESPGTILSSPGRPPGLPAPAPTSLAARLAPPKPAPGPTQKVPVPNVRADLTPDLEMEMAAALGDAPLDEVLSTDVGSPADADLEPETRLIGRVLSVHRDSVFLDLGGRRQGILKLITLDASPEHGALMEVTVSRLNLDEGLYELGLPGSAVAVEDWSQISEGMVVDARVTGHNTGGLECEVHHLHAFIPASQISLYRVEDLSQFVDQKFTCVVTEVKPERRRLVLSRRAVLEREKAEAREKIMAELEVGQIREGTVRSLREFGAFVDIGGLDGLIHISQLSWDRIKHASEVLEEGQKIKVKIQKIDPETGKIGLAFRDLSESPWSGAVHRYPSRGKATGTISRITEFGAFVKLEPGIEGLIHISELSHKRVWRVEDIVQEGQTVEVLVQSVDPEQQRISLSLKALEARAVPAKKEDEPEPEETPAPPKRTQPLKGGRASTSGGEKFGLKW